DMISPVDTMDEGETLSKALRRLEDSEILVATKNGKYAGELRPDMLLRFKGDADIEKVKRIARKGQVISEKDASKFANVFDKFSNSGMSRLVVLDRNDKPLGIIRASDVLRHLTDSLSSEKATEFMEKVISADASTPSDKAEEMMARNGVSELAVLEKGKLLGMLHVKDLAIKVKPYLHKKMHNVKQSQRMDVEKESIKSVMTPEFEIRKVLSSQSLGDALRTSNFEEAYVFEGQKMLGRVSYYKILKGFEIKEPAKVEISGLGREEEMFKESLYGECAALLSKFGKGGEIHLRIKSARKGKEKKLYDVHGRLEIGGKTFVCASTEMKGHRENWDLGMAVSEVLFELREMYVKSKR
ncbi:MAG: CBS domain-containing protein, partial [Candidatus Micrarchaeota archaeon]